MKAWKKALGLVLVWVAIVIAFNVALNGSFATPVNFEIMIRQTVITGFTAIGMTFIIITGAIDLSVGSLVALVTVVIAFCLKSGMAPLPSALVGVLSGGVAGWANGFLTTKLKVGSFIVTLATLLAFRGIAKGVANEQKIDVPMNWLRNMTGALPPDQRWQILPPGGWMVIALGVLAHWVLNSSVFGRHVVATGSNEATARMCGINTDRVSLWVFGLAGLCFGLAGLTQFSRLTVGDPTVAVGLELSVIAAVVIGGASLNGGEGSIFGSLVGALIMTTIASGGSQSGWPNWVQEIVTGAIILTAVALDRWRLARAAAAGAE
ncbi:MAG: ABC transporter permease [Fimbriimonadaceae bacterium]|nr:ABC transporter permease [Fimbriimonadaceae bacterium]